MEKRKLKFLLLQIREDKIVRKEEWESFAKHAGLEVSQIDIHNVFDTPTFNGNVLKGYDGLFIGGASEASVSDPDSPFMKSIIDLIHYTVERSIPVFASCFGFQAAILAFDGEILKDKENFEMGTLPISLSEAANTDPLYEGIEDPFFAVSVHQEKCILLPENLELLAYTENCIHSFRVPKKPFWAFQFHPELDCSCLKERLGVYREKYTDDDGHYEKIIDSLVEVPESNSLVQKFVQVVLNLSK